MKTLRAELHVHTLLSPCAEVEMIPPLIIQQALEMGIGILAVTDHNASANTAAVIQAARGTGIHVLPGMELQTREEVHCLCLFDDLDQVAAWQTLVDAALPDLPNRTDYFGEQFVVDETGQFIRSEEQLLLTSTSLSLEEAAQRVQQLGGLFIPAHVDRQAFGLIANLGFIPPELQVSAIEISRLITPAQARTKYSQLLHYPLLQSGDVHRLDEFFAPTYFTIEEPTIAEISKALTQTDGRTVEIHS